MLSNSDILEIREIVRDIIRETSKKTSETTVRLTLRELGLEKLTYKQSQVVSTYGYKTYKRSLNYVRWKKDGEGKTSPVTCMRSEFDDFLRKFDIELKIIK